jgi:hypothetical protein
MGLQWRIGLLAGRVGERAAKIKTLFKTVILTVPYWFFSREEERPERSDLACLAINRLGAE